MVTASLEPQSLPKNQVSFYFHPSCLPFHSSTPVPTSWPPDLLLTIVVHPQQVVRHCIQIQSPVGLEIGVGDAHPG